MKKTDNGSPANDVPIYRVYEAAEMFIDVVCVRNWCPLWEADSSSTN